ncbi:AEC family transporter [Paracoccus marinaquae]|uniref:AEC family transporter n=1 Tax=Paracoccus marinaquae TaxID=2841926 RepID=A0ABS6AF82_9RHOB|nr:AEC family transporter [Paracoccus marinaquae]MBU3028767.1 AEC family transporter [Paracoccus marinaquae]
MQPLLSILPVIALVAFGHLARRWRLIAPENWPGIEQLGFRILFPAILLTSIYRSELSIGALGRYLAALALAFAATGALALAMRRPLRLGNARTSSLFQAAMRFNSLLILAVAAQALGPRALSDLAVAFAFLIPAFNISAIIALTLLPPEDANALPPSRRQALRRISAEILRNPLVLGCVAGLALNLSGMELAPWLLAPLDWLGQGALAIGLLSVGAGIQIRRLWQSDPAMWAGVVMRLLLCPALFLAIAIPFGLSGGQLASGLLATAAPGASVGYILARQMGGDAEFYADIFTWQTVLSALSLPLWLLLAAWLAG